MKSSTFEFMKGSVAAERRALDALMMGIMEEKDYALSDFALIHPGGAVGKKIK